MLRRAQLLRLPADGQGGTNLGATQWMFINIPEVAKPVFLSLSLKPCSFRFLFCRVCREHV
jgi:hypothetical protein